ncbi:hypothetical protein AAVH_10167 [Aphelenchoides avenae]|nr:hypothetical protein AAVH_10167 [Aphelenchus avenae]
MSDPESEPTSPTELRDHCGRLAVSSGEPSLDGSVGDEDRALSDSELQNVLRSETLARQVKGPSSDALEHHCEKERIQAVKREMESEAASHNCDSHCGSPQTSDAGWEDVLGSGDLRRRVLKEGSGEKAKNGHWVTIRVKCPTNEVDNHEKLRFVLGYSMVIDAWELIVQLMRPGETCAVSTAARFAYGDAGLDTRIPPDQPQEYEIELLDVGAAVGADGPEQHFHDFMEMLKQRGRFYFHRQDFQHALNVYKKAADLIQRMEEESLNELLATFYSNISACYVKLSEWKDVLEHAEKSLALNDKSAKVWYRKAEALTQRKDYDEALEALTKATDLEPSDKLITREITRVQSLRRQQREQEKRVYKRMLGGIHETKENRWRTISLRWAVLAIMVVVFAGLIHFIRPLVLSQFGR